jgi:hypothetical protein
MKCVGPLNLVASRLALKNLPNAAREESADGDRLWAASYLFNQKRRRLMTKTMAIREDKLQTLC